MPVRRQGSLRQFSSLAHPTQAYFLMQGPDAPLPPMEPKRSPSAKVKKASWTSGSEQAQREGTDPKARHCPHFRRPAGALFQTVGQIWRGRSSLSLDHLRRWPLPQVHSERAFGTAFAMRLPAYVAVLGEPPPQSLPKAGFVGGRLPPSFAAGGPFGARLPAAKPAARTSPSLGRLRLSNSRCGRNVSVLSRW